MIGLKIGEVTKIQVQSWAVPIVYGMAGCVYGEASKSVSYCTSAVDLNYAW